MSALTVSHSPHIRGADSAQKIMWSVVLALLPAAANTVWLFGPRALFVMLVCIFSCLLAEYAVRTLLRGLPVSLLDGSAVVTGLLLSFNLPPSIPLWMAAVGAGLAIGVGKEAFGGLGGNIFNPALVGRAFLLASWPVAMTRWHTPEEFRRAGVDAVTSATALGILKEKLSLSLPSVPQLLLGDRAGCIGEGCILALLLGAAFLLARGVITWHAPLSFIAAAGTLCWLFMPGPTVYYLLSGGLVLGAFFMATDYPTTPITPRGQIVFGIGCGLLTFIIRRYGGYPEGVCYSILIMNAATPLIERFTRPRPFGSGRKGS